MRMHINEDEGVPLPSKLAVLVRFAGRGSDPQDHFLFRPSNPSIVNDQTKRPQRVFLFEVF